MGNALSVVQNQNPPPTVKQWCKFALRQIHDAQSAPRPHSDQLAISYFSALENAESLMLMCSDGIFISTTDDQKRALELVKDGQAAADDFSAAVKQMSR